MDLKIFLFSLCLLTSCYLQAFIAQSTVEEIPSKDLIPIRRFFQYIIYQTPSPFTFFGDKPITLIDLSTEINLFSFIESSYSSEIIKDYKIWKAYESKYPSKNFIFKEEIQEPDNYSIILINKQICLLTIENNLQLFHEILNTQSSPEEILDDICKSRIFSRDVLHGHQGLLGILLGYGKNNSFAFHDIYTDQKLFYKPLQFFNNEPKDPMLLFSLPEFVAVENDAETLFLKEKYIQNREKIVNIYREGDFFEITLRKILD